MSIKSTRCDSQIHIWVGFR